MSEEQQRWGGARDTGTLDMDKFRQEIKQEDDQSVKRRQEEAGYKSSTGYGATKTLFRNEISCSSFLLM